MNLHVFPTNKQRENNNYQLNSCGQTRTLNITFAGRPSYQELNQQSANANLTAEKLTVMNFSRRQMTRVEHSSSINLFLCHSTITCANNTIQKSMTVMESPDKNNLLRQQNLPAPSQTLSNIPVSWDNKCHTTAALYAERLFFWPPVTNVSTTKPCLTQLLLWQSFFLLWKWYNLSSSSRPRLNPSLCPISVQCSAHSGCEVEGVKSSVEWL